MVLTSALPPKLLWRIMCSGLKTHGRSTEHVPFWAVGSIANIHPWSEASKTFRIETPDWRTSRGGLGLCPADNQRTCVPRWLTFRHSRGRESAGGRLVVVPVVVQRPRVTAEALRVAPGRVAGGTDAARVERVPFVSARARPPVVLPGAPRALRAANEVLAIGGATTCPAIGLLEAQLAQHVPTVPEAGPRSRQG